MAFSRSTPATRRALAATLAFLAVAALTGRASAEDKPVPAAKDVARERDKAFAAAADFSLIRDLAILADGRRKPFETYCRERVRSVTGDRSLDGEDPVFTALEMALDPESFASRPAILVRNLELTKAFTGDPNLSRMRVSLEKARTSEAYLAIADAVDMDKKDKNPLERAVSDLERARLLAERMPRELRIIPVSDDPVVPWSTVEALPRIFTDGRFEPLLLEWGQLVSSFRARDAQRWNAAAKKVRERILGYDFKVYPEDSAIAIECIYNKVRPFHQAALLYLAAVACGICSLVAESRAKKVAGAVARSWPRWLALGTFAGALAFHVAGLVVRAYLEQRAPVASFYETLLWITGAASLIALVFGIVTRGSVVPPVVAGVVGALALTLGDNLKVYVETQNMEPLQPVLNSYWLNIHVTCMLTSYGAFALAFGTAIVYALAHARGAASGTSDAQKAQLEWLEDLNYRVIQVGFVLLTAGTGLGAVWANQSWGRYWGWDPKETGAFITWIVYAAYLHFRFMGWVKGIRSAVWNMAGFAMVMFTYIGVSFFLTGKHSYLE